MTFIADYSRQLSLDWMSDSKQALITQSKLLIFGAGGLGVAAISYLSGAGVGTITIVDSDRIEASNLHRQTIYRVSDIGHYKAQVAASYMTERNPNSVINAITGLMDLHGLYQLCEQHTVVLDCTDDQPFSYLLNSLCLVSGKKAVFANAVKLEGQLFVLDPDKNKPCFNCLWPNPQSTNQTCHQVGVLGPVPGVLGCLQALEAIKILVGEKSHLTEHLLHCDFSTYELTKLKILKNDSCNHQLVYSDLQKAFEAYSLKIVPRAQDLNMDGDRLIDIRSSEEVKSDPSDLTVTHIAFEELAAKPENFIERELHYWLICSSGKRSKALCDHLQKLGYRLSPCRLY